jgi:flagellar biosynthesis/type III secretory pathway protein FliH
MESTYNYMLALPENERTENVKAMVNKILLDAENYADERYEEGVDQGRDLGYDSGRDDGYEDGLRDGFEEGANSAKV